MKIEYHQNPLKTRVELDDKDKLLIRRNIEIEELYNALYELAPDKFEEISNKAQGEVERILPYYLDALDGEIHCGDCTNVCCSCTKCHAEDFACVDTLDGIRQPHYVNKAFAADVETLEEAIQYLKDNPAKATWEGSEQWVPRWQAAQEQTIEDLIKYKEKHFK